MKFRVVVKETGEVIATLAAVDRHTAERIAAHDGHPLTTHRVEHERGGKRIRRRRERRGKP